MAVTVHSESYTMWAPDEMATPGIVQLAETGSTSVLAAEVASDAAAVQQPLTVAGNDGESPPGVGNGEQSAVVTAEAPLAYISAATMMAVRQALMRARALHTLPAPAECTHI